MKDPKQPASPSRRRFLRDMGVSGGIAAAATTTPGLVLADNEATQAGDRPQEGYRLTQHILDYYKSAAS